MNIVQIQLYFWFSNYISPEHLQYLAFWKSDISFFSVFLYLQSPKFENMLIIKKPL